MNRTNLKQSRSLIGHKFWELLQNKKISFLKVDYDGDTKLSKAKFDAEYTECIQNQPQYFKVSIGECRV